MAKNSTKSKWTQSDGNQPMLSRFSGKTFPCILYSKEKKAILGRDNNGKHVSQTLETTDLTENGFRKILNGISTPHPTQEDINTFLSKIPNYK